MPLFSIIAAMKNKLCFGLSALAVALFVCAPIGVRANTIALDFTSDPGAEQFISRDETVGWRFSVSQMITVTNLGVWDGPPIGIFNPDLIGDGLLFDHKVSIWTDTESLVATSIVPAGTSAQLLDDSRYVSIAPTQLTPGNYVIGSYWNDQRFPQDPDAFATTSLTTAAGITYGGKTFSPGDTFPLGLGGQFSGIFGPNFQFTQAGVNVPESGNTLFIMLASLMTLFVLRAVVSRRGKLRV
jgi:hypothetical protein